MSIRYQRRIPNRKQKYYKSLVAVERAEASEEPDEDNVLPHIEANNCHKKTSQSDSELAYHGDFLGFINFILTPGCTTLKEFYVNMAWLGQQEPKHEYQNLALVAHT